MERLTELELEALGAIVAEFERKLRASEQPEVRDYLPAEPPLRSVYLVELLHAELEYRIAGPDVRLLEELVERFPELKNSPDELVELALCEYRLRKQHDPFVSIETYCHHYAELAPQLRSALGKLGGDPVVICPHCQRAVEAGERLIRCPRCQGEFQLTRPPDPHSLRQLANYDLREQLGAGSFGVVFRARDKRLGREVAIKIPSRGYFRSLGEAERFVREARVVAQLKHPGILPVYEVGQNSGLPFIVSKLVHGVSLDRWLDQKPIDARTSARILRDVARALAQAHQQQVLHRDIKPANIILEQSGEWSESSVGLTGTAARVFLMDFGLASQTESIVTVTQTGDRVGTPAYMSPEVIRLGARHACPASDVYSLGVVLYEMLSGVLPFRGTPGQLLKQIVDEEPPAIRKFNESVSRDLETIVHKCLQKAPTHRYRTAVALADDLQRWLNHEPILARPVSRLVVAFRWCQRHPLVTALSFCILMVAFSSLALALWQWNREVNLAQRAASRLSVAKDLYQQAVAARDQADNQLQLATEQREKARLAEGTALAEQERSIQEEQRAETKREQAQQNATRVLEVASGFLSRMSSDPRLRESGLETLREEFLRSATDLYRQLLESEGDDPEVLTRLSRDSVKLALLSDDLGKLPEALVIIRQARQIDVELLGRFPEVASHRRRLADGYNNEGIFLWRTGETERAGQAFRSAKQQMLELAQDLHGQLTDHDRHNIAVYDFYRGILLSETGELLQALAALGDSADVFTDVISRNPENIDWRSSLASVHQNMGSIFRNLGDDDQALEHFREAVKLHRSILELGSNLPVHRMNLASSLSSIAISITRSGRPLQAQAFYSQAINLLLDLVERHPDVLEYQFDLATTLLNRGEAFVRSEDFQQAEESFEQAITIRRKHPQPHRTIKSYAHDFATTLYCMARLLFNHSDRDREALAYLDEALPLVNHFVERSGLDARSNSLLYDLHEKRAQILSWLEESDLAIEAWTAATGYGTDRERAFAELSLILELAAAGDYHRTIDRADAFVAAGDRSGPQLADTAFAYALALTAMDEDPSLSSEQRQTLQKRATTEAVRLLTRLVKERLLPAESLRELASDKRFEPLAEHELLQQLFDEVRAAP